MSLGRERTNPERQCGSWTVCRAVSASHAPKPCWSVSADEKRDVPFAKPSRDTKRALIIAAALAHRPFLVFLGETGTGLD